MGQIANYILFRQHDHACPAGFAFSDDNKTNPYSESKLSYHHSMDEEPPPPNPQEEAVEEEPEEQEDILVAGGEEEDWLQLGLSTTSASSTSRGRSGRRQEAPTELQLFRDRPSSSSAAPGIDPWSGFTLSVPVPASPERRLPESAGEAAVLRVISPPRRQSTGIWLMLKAYQNQGRWPLLLPQIPNNYLRIKDGRMTVRLLMKYVAAKLALEDESQVEITCRDQLLHPSQTLQYVRDSVWCWSDAPPSALTAGDYIMTLQYRGSTSGTWRSHP